MDEIKMKLLHKDLTFNKDIFVDAQEYNSTIKLGDTQVDVYKRLYIDYIVKDINLESYIDDDKILKVIKVKTYSDYQEIFISEVENIKVNGIDKLAIIVNSDDKKIDYKTIITDFAFNTGDIIQYQGSKWIIISEVSKTNTIYKSTMRKCRELTYNKNIIYGLVDSQIFDIESTKYFNLTDNQILITISDKIKIKLDEIIEFNKKAYSVKAVNDTIENTLILRCQYSMSDTHNYTMETNTNISIEVVKTYQIITTCKDNNVVVVNPILAYTVNDNSICTVDTKGNITAVKIGNTTIKVNYENMETNINITVSSIPIGDIYTITTVQGKFAPYININNPKTYKIVDDKGIDVTDKTFTFSLLQSTENPTITPTQLIVSLAIISETRVKLMANNKEILGKFILQAICKENNVITQVVIKIKQSWDRDID